MPADTAPGPRRERPARTRLTPERERELYEAVLELLREVGYDGLRMDAVAARTRSSKATLYRQWGGKPELVATAIRETRPVQVRDIDTGSLAGDLRELVRRAAAQMQRDTPVVLAMAHASERDPELGRVLREAFVEPQKAALGEMLERAVARGELDPDRPARAFLPQMVIGGILTRPLLEGRRVDRAYLTRYLESVVLPALGIPA